MDYEKAKELLKEIEKMACDHGFEDHVRKSKFEAMLRLLAHNEFRHCDLIPLYNLLKESNYDGILNKYRAFVSCAFENLDKESIVDLRDSILKLAVLTKNRE